MNFNFIGFHRILFLIPMVIITLSLEDIYAQAAQTLGNQGKGIEFNPQPQGVISEMPLTEPKTIGTSYLFDTWHLGNIDLGENGMIRNQFIRYDLANQFIEIKFDSIIKAVDGIFVDNFSLVDIDGLLRNYVNCNQYVYEDTRLLGFFEIITDGEYSLFLKTESVFIESDYVMQLDMGTRDHKIIKNEEYYIANNNGVIKVPKSRSNILEIYSSTEGLKEFLKKEKISTKNASDLKKLVDFLNKQNS
jgi:hypothetical protein